MVVDNVGLKICLVETSNSTVTLTFVFLGVNRSGRGTSSTTNHRSYMAWGQLHGLWCKQPLNDHYWCIKLGVEWLLCGPKMANYKSGSPKWCNARWDVVFGWIGVVSHHLRLLLGPIELTILCPFVWRVDILMINLGRFYTIQVGVWLTCLFRKM